MPDDTVSLVGIFLVLLLGLSWHEAAHAWVADRLGDPTARSLGRVTLNPLKHLDPFFSVILPALAYLTLGVAFGGGKPVPVNPRNFRHRARDFMLVALAGPGSNLLLAGAFSVAYAVCGWNDLFVSGETIVNPYGGSNVEPVASFNRALWRVLSGEMLGSVGETVVVFGVALNVLLAVFNLMPIPPLDGSRVIGWLLPRRLQGLWYSLDRIGILFVAVIFLMLDGFKWVLAYAVFPILELYTRFTDNLLDLNPFS